MTSAREGTEAALIAVSLGLFLGYHVWLFGFRGKGYKASIPDSLKQPGMAAAENTGTVLWMKPRCAKHSFCIAGRSKIP